MKISPLVAIIALLSAGLGYSHIKAQPQTQDQKQAPIQTQLNTQAQGPIQTKISPQALLQTQHQTAIEPQAQTTLMPEPLYPEKWAEVERYIRDNWMNFVESNPRLPKPYSYALNPGTLYYYDLYFINDALLKQGFIEQARNNLDCFIYVADSLSFIPNAYGWGESRSQLPFFSMMVRDYYEKTGDKEWLKKAYPAVLKEYDFWTNRNGNQIEDHSTSIPGLQRFGQHADTAELLEFYDRVLFYRFHVSRDVPDSTKLRIAAQRLAECESMDFTPRYYGRCMDFIPVDLNANLYQYERNFAYFERELGIKGNVNWDKAAKKRAALMKKYLWSPLRGLMLDYDYVHGKHTAISCITSFTALMWHIIEGAQAEEMKNNLLRELEVKSGLTVCSESQEDIPYQFGRTAIWGSMQFQAMKGLIQAGFRTDAKRVALKYLNMVTKNYVDPYPDQYIPHKTHTMVKRPYGCLWEKFTHDGDINDNEYYSSPILGFTAAPYILALEIIRSK